MIIVALGTRWEFTIGTRMHSAQRSRDAAHTTNNDRIAGYTSSRLNGRARTGEHAVGMISDIDEVQKAASAQIKIAEAKKTDLKKISEQVEQKSKSINSEAKKVLSDLTVMLQQLEYWEQEYDSWVESLKDLNSGYPALKKKCAEIERFYEQLLSEKTERDKAIKSGKSKISPRDAELLDVVFKKAKQNYENYVKSGAATAQADFLKGIGEELKQREKYHSEMVSEVKRAIGNYDTMLKALSDHSTYLKVTSIKSDMQSQFKDMAAAYEKYFKVFPT